MALFYDGRNFKSFIGLTGENFDTQLKKNFNFFWIFLLSDIQPLIRNSFHHPVCYSFMVHIAARVVLQNISSMAHNLHRYSKKKKHYSNRKFF